MCVIVDANVVSHFFDENEDYRPVWVWLRKEDGILVYGGQLAEECRKVGKAWKTLKVLHQAGRAVLFAETTIREEVMRIEREFNLESNDQAIIALARVSGARILCCKDKRLHSDFTNPRYVSHPRGKVYQSPSHKHLLKHHTGCKKNRNFSST